jgi:hypothetical protein
MVIARYADGTPITVTYGDDTCVQPITPTSQHIVDDMVLATFDEVGQQGEGDVYPYDPAMYYIPLVGELQTPTAEDEDELEPCDVQADYLGYVEEVDLGRLNLGRSPDRVLSKQLGEVEAFLNSGTIGLDASGRFTRSIDDIVVQTLDQPLGNLAAFQSILTTGDIGTETIPDVPLTDWELTGAQLAAGAPKEDFVITVDTVQYLNRILGVPEVEAGLGLPMLTGENAEMFLNFSGVTFYRDGGAMQSYSRAAMFPGSMCFLDLVDGWKDPSIMSHVFGDEPSEGLEGIAGYVQFAEDAHKVLVEVHRLGLTLDFISSITEPTVPDSCGPTP